jgi:hypothetical protein
MKIFHHLLLLACICANAVMVSAGEFDGSKPLICAVLQVVTCPEGEEPSTGDAASVNLPQFFHIDVTKLLIQGKGADGKNRETKIEKVTRTGGKLILQGVQLGKAWSAVIDEESGKTVLVGVDNGIGMVVFGACTTK